MSAQLDEDSLPALHNGIADVEDDQQNVVPGAWRQLAQLEDVQHVQRGNRGTMAGERQRDTLRHYFNNPVGAVPWQDRMIDG